VFRLRAALIINSTRVSRLPRRGATRRDATRVTFPSKQSVRHGPRRKISEILSRDPSIEYSFVHRPKADRDWTISVDDRSLAMIERVSSRGFTKGPSDRLRLGTSREWRYDSGNDEAIRFAEQIAARRRHGRRGRLQESVVELVAEKSDIARLQDWKGLVRNGHERPARQRWLAHAATRRCKGEFIRTQQTLPAGSDRLRPRAVSRENEFTRLAALWNKLIPTCALRCRSSWPRNAFPLTTRALITRALRGREFGTIRITPVVEEGGR